MKFQTAISTAALILGLTTAHTYDEAIGLKAMYYAGAAYCNLDVLKSWTCGEPCQDGVTDFYPVENPLLNTFGYTAYNAKDNEIIVSFRGTQMGTILNWISDLDYHRVQYKDLNGSLVHNGFYTTYNMVSWEVIWNVETLLQKYPTASILVTGHSLGAALATHAAVDIKRSI